MLPALAHQSFGQCWTVVAAVKQWQLSMALAMQIGLNFAGSEDGTEMPWLFVLGCALKFQFSAGNAILEAIARVHNTCFQI